MARNFIGRCKTLVKNAFNHGRFVSAGEETAKDALKRLGNDVRKLGRGKKVRESNEVQRSVRDLVQEGANLFNTKRYREAEEVLREAILIDDTYPRAYNYLGHVLLKQERFKEAKSAFKTAIKLDPKSRAARKAKKKLKEISLKGSLEDLRDMDELD